MEYLKISFFIIFLIVLLWTIFADIFLKKPDVSLWLGKLFDNPKSYYKTQYAKFSIIPKIIALISLIATGILGAMGY